ncbi:MAG: serine/threonine protein kinase [Parabacteroides sp.]
MGTIRTEVPVCVKEYFFKDYCYRDRKTGAVLVHSETGKKLFDKFKEKLIKEAKILSEVHHPYIVNVLEVFEENNTAYIAMEYISGHSLKHKMEKEGVLPEAVVLKYIQQIGTALQFVHEKSILHLDIKPSNILIDKNDDARLIDFGVSKRYDLDQQETSTTMLTLSKGFASIEQYDDEGTNVFSPCPDIYSLGATMYNLLTGKIPTESILRATRPLVKPSELNKELSAHTEEVILKAMEIVPANRYQRVEDMLKDLSLPLLDVSRLTPSTQVAPEEEPSLPEAEDEETLLVNQGRRNAEDEDDVTLVNRPQPVEEPVKQKRKGLWITMILSFMALIGSTVAYLHGNRIVSVVTKKVTDQTVDSLAQDVLAETASVPVETLPEEVKKEEEATPVAVAEKPKESVVQPDTQSKTQPKAEREVAVKTESKATAKVQSPSPVKQEEPAPTAEELDAEYARLLALGREQMDMTNYAEARRLLTDAKNVKLTEEVVRLLIDCDAKAEAKQLADRKAQYEEKMDFGKYKIVRKKSTGRYGAIDANAEERIPCKYLSVGKADNGRAFEREDNLYDIYRADGSLASQGVIDY